MEHDAVILSHRAQTHRLLKGSCCLNRGDVAIKLIFLVFKYFK